MKVDLTANEIIWLGKLMGRIEADGGTVTRYPTWPAVGLANKLSIALLPEAEQMRNHIGIGAMT